MATPAGEDSRHYAESHAKGTKTLIHHAADLHSPGETVEFVTTAPMRPESPLLARFRGVAQAHFRLERRSFHLELSPLLCPECVPGGYFGQTSASALASENGL